MATSGSTDHTNTAYSIIKAAFQKIGVVPVGRDPTGAQTQFGYDELNDMIKAWTARMGYNLWTIERGTMNLTADQASYDMGTGGDFSVRPQRITHMVYVESSTNEIPMRNMSRSEYFNLPNKTNTGSPTSFYYDPQLTTGKLYLWPVTNQSGKSVKFDYQRIFEDFDANSNNPDFPQEWHQAIKLSLAAKLHGTYFPKDVAERDRLKAEAEYQLDLVMDYDVPTEDVQIELDSEWNSERF